MINIRAKFESKKEMKTKTNYVFSTSEKINEMEEIQLIGSIGYLVFNGDELNKQALEIARNKKFAVNTEKLSPSSELRFSIVRLWQQSKEAIGVEEYYQREMKKINDHYKNKVEKSL